MGTGQNELFFLLDFVDNAHPCANFTEPRLRGEGMQLKLRSGTAVGAKAGGLP